MTDEEMAGGLTDEQMTAPEQGGPESFLHPDKFKPSPAHRKFKNTGPIDEVRAGLAAQRPTTDIGELTAAPINSALNISTGGLMNWALRGGGSIPAIDQLREQEGDGQTGVEHLGRELASRTVEGQSQYRAAHPTLSRYTDLPGYFTGVPGAISNQFGRLATAIAARSPGNPIGLLAQLYGPAATMQVMQAGSEGATLPEALHEAHQAGTDALATGVPLAVAGKAASAAGRALRETKGAQARQFLEQQGVKVGVSTPGEGGPMDSMVTQGHSDADIGHQAEVSAEKGLKMLADEAKAVKGIPGRRIGQIAQTPEAAQLHDVSDVVTNMRAALEELDLSPHAEGDLTAALAKIEKKQGQGFNPETDNYLLSEADLNKLRRRLDKAARTGESNDAALAPLKAAADQVRGLVEQGPFNDANKEYSRVTKDYQQSRKLLGIAKKPKGAEESQTAVNTVKNAITRRGQNTVTAGGQENRLAQFEAKHPDIGAELARPEILRKRADISFHLLPTHGGLLDRMTGGHHGIATAIGLGAGGLTGALPALALTNLPAIQARLLYGPALGMQALEPLLLQANPGLAKLAEQEAR